MIKFIGTQRIMFMLYVGWWISFFFLLAGEELTIRQASLSPILKGKVDGYTVNLEWEDPSPDETDFHWELHIAGKKGIFRFHRSFSKDQLSFQGRIVPGEWQYRIRKSYTNQQKGEWSNTLVFEVQRQTLHSNSIQGEKILKRCDDSPPPLNFREERLRQNTPQNNVILALPSNDGSSPVNGSLSETRINALLSPYKWGITTITYSFYSYPEFQGEYYGEEQVSEVSEATKSRFRQVFGIISRQVNLNFVEVPENKNHPTQPYGHIRIMLSNGPLYAYSYYPTTNQLTSLAGDIHLNPVYDTDQDLNGFQRPPGSHGFTTLIHELGHALGLKHPHDAPVTLPSSEDNLGNTVMTYNLTYAGCASFVRYDIAALQYLYGVRQTATTNTVYTVGPSIYDYIVDGTTYFSNREAPIHHMIYDTNGTDTLDLRNVTSGNLRIELESGGYICRQSDYFSSTQVYAGICTAYNYPLEVVITSPGNNLIYSGSQPNIFSGYGPLINSGNDTIFSATPQDILNLSAFLPSEVQLQKSNDHLIIRLNGTNQVTIQNYYSLTSHQTPVIIYKKSDVQNPSSPSNFSFVPISQNTAVLSWSPATDDVQVLTYLIRRNGTLVAYLLGTETSYTDYSLTPGMTYTYSIQARDASLNLSPLLEQEVLMNRPPVASFSISGDSGEVPFSVTCDASGSYDPDGTIQTYHWDFGDGEYGYGKIITHTYYFPGNYTISLTVTDNLGITHTISRLISVTDSDPSPTAVIRVSTQKGNPPLTVSVDGSLSWDGDGNIVSYFWDFGDGTTSSEISTSHDYLSPGTYTITLTVTDNDSLTHTDSRVIHVNYPPIPSVTVTPGTKVQVSSTIQLDATASYDTDGSITQYVWTMGNGDQRTGAIVNYTYSDPGNYFITLKVVDNDNASATYQITITVTTKSSSKKSFGCVMTTFKGNFDIVWLIFIVGVVGWKLSRSPAIRYKP